MNSQLSLDPPFYGTIFVAPDIYLETDPSCFASLRALGRGKREMFDRRIDGVRIDDAYLFEGTFSDGLTLVAQVSSEFAEAWAEALASKYLWAIGQLPTELRRGLETVTINDGLEKFAGGERGVMIHRLKAEEYARDGILTETLFHEAVHATVDDAWRDDPDWLRMRGEDPTFVSTYARDFPDREDLAESLLLCIAMTQRPERLPEGMADLLSSIIPNRIEFFRTRMNWNIDPTSLPT